jgi:hypothetical protein
MNQTLRSAMGEDFPFWHQRFVAVEVPTPYKFFGSSDLMVFCADYESPQLKLPRIPPPFSDGVERLIRLAEQKKAEYLTRNWDATFPMFMRIMHNP